MVDSGSSQTKRDRGARPEVTVGLPVYNGAEFIEQALEGLLGQTYRNFTLLISDNASTDGTWEILQAWAARDDRIVLHRQETNIDMVPNFRYVLDQADTEYFMWHSYDDWREPNFLEELIRVFASVPECAAACSATSWIYPGRAVERREPFPDPLAASRRWRVVQTLRHSSGGWYYGLYRTEDLRKAQIFAEAFGFVWGNDRILILYFILNDKVRGTNKTTFVGRKTYLSNARYRPNGPAAQLRFVARYLWFHLRLLRDSEMSPGEKLLCLPWLLSHAGRTMGFGKFGKFRGLVNRVLPGGRSI